ncbi:MAG: hypothetical protein J6B87_04750 [Clostridia bacterium]|nr:hypothetical protein [Clostridia bacterium]
MSYFEEMDDIEFGEKLFESEMGTEMNEEEIHAQRCVAKGKRARRLIRNNIFSRRHGDWPSDMSRRMEMKASNKRARYDVMKMNVEARNTMLEEEELEMLDILPAKQAGWLRCSWAFV